MLLLLVVLLPWILVLLPWIFVDFKINWLFNWVFNSLTVSFNSAISVYTFALVSSSFFLFFIIWQVFLICYAIKDKKI